MYEKTEDMQTDLHDAFKNIFDEAMVHFTKLVSADPIFRLGIGILKVQIIFIALFAKFGSSNIHTDFDFASVPGFFNGLNTKINSFLKMK